MESETKPKEWDTVVTLECVTLGAGERYATGLTGVDLYLAGGQAAIVRVPRAGLTTPLADLCCGLEAPETGVVHFLGQPWDAKGHAQAARDRGRIGHVWPHSAWLGNLDIDENILLAQRHHTGRSDTELREEAQTLAQAFGLDDLPGTRPPWTPEVARRKSQWVRALMGTPHLLLLEYPDDDANDVDRIRFVEAVEQARMRGAAVIWITARSDFALPDQSGTVYQAKLIGSTLTWRAQENGMSETTKEKSRE